MLDRDRLRRVDDALGTAFAARGADPKDYDRWVQLDSQRREALVKAEDVKRQRNEASKEIGAKKSRGEDASEAIAAVGMLKRTIAAAEASLEAIESELGGLEMAFPNLQHASVPNGKGEEDNVMVREVGTPTKFDFQPQAHWDLGTELGVLDFERAAKLAGARFTVSVGWAARLERALANFMLDLHTGEHGYTEVNPPLLVNQDSMVGSGQLPKFADDAFRVDHHGYYLIPTAEVPLANLHRDEVVDEASLPLCYAAWTPCFRAEAGSYGKDVRGLIRQHQFHKVELVQYAHPEESYEALEKLTGHASKVLDLLELPYRVMTLCSGDMGFAAAKTHDLEVWVPGQGAYREISSCSNCEDFQARRANLRYRPSGGGKPRFVHTLNGSALAIGRTVVAILENYQQADGSIRVPEVLKPFLGGTEVFTTRR